MRNFMMSKHLLALATVITPLALGISQVQAQSWQESTQSNPTYPASTSASPNNTSPGPSSQPSFSQPQPTTRQTQPQPSSPNSISSPFLSTQHPVFEQQFMVGCQRDGLPQSYCRCALKEVQNNYTFEEVMTIAQFMQNNREIPTELMNVAMKCLLG